MIHTVYTVGIKRKYWFGFKKYAVKGHRTQFELNKERLDKPRLILTLEDGSELAIADILSRDFMLYSDFKQVQRRLEEEREREAWFAARDAEQAEFKKYLEAKSKESVAPLPNGAMALVKEA